MGLFQNRTGAARNLIWSRGGVACLHRATANWANQNGFAAMTPTQKMTTANHIICSESLTKAVPTAQQSTNRSNSSHRIIDINYLDSSWKKSVQSMAIGIAIAALRWFPFRRRLQKEEQRKELFIQRDIKGGHYSNYQKLHRYWVFADRCFCVRLTIKACQAKMLLQWHCTTVLVL